MLPQANNSVCGGDHASFLSIRRPHRHRIAGSVSQYLEKSAGFLVEQSYGNYEPENRKTREGCIAEPNGLYDSNRIAVSYLSIPANDQKGSMICKKPADFWARRLRSTPI
jgi:hypothetical protein